VFGYSYVCCKIEGGLPLRSSGGSVTITMFPAAMPPGWPPAPNGSRRLTDIDQLQSSYRKWVFLHDLCIYVTLATHWR
jgi:hypothetical protein